MQNIHVYEFLEKAINYNHTERYSATLQSARVLENLQWLMLLENGCVPRDVLVSKKSWNFEQNKWKM